MVIGWLADNLGLTPDQPTEGDLSGTLRGPGRAVNAANTFIPVYGTEGPNEGFNRNAVQQGMMGSAGRSAPQIGGGGFDMSGGGMSFGQAMGTASALSGMASGGPPSLSQLLQMQRGAQAGQGLRVREGLSMGTMMRGSGTGYNTGIAGGLGTQQAAGNPNAQQNQARNMAGEVRGAQEQLLGDLQKQAAGEGPSLAQFEADRMRDANLNQSLALAASQPGVSAGLALRQAQQQAGAGGIAAAQQATAGRMQEQLNAQGQLGALAGQIRAGDMQTRGQDLQFRGQDIGLAQSNQQANLQQQALNDAMSRYYTSQSIGMDQADFQRQLAARQLDLQNQQAYNNALAGLAGANMQGQAAGTGALLGGLGTLGGAGILALSDERAKENIKQSDSEEISDFLRSIRAVNYDYVGDDMPKSQVGVLAQDIEQTPVGASMVVDTPGGKMLNVGSGLGVALNALSQINERLERLENKGKRGGR